jgi:hypothetical protein
MGNGFLQVVGSEKMRVGTKSLLFGVHQIFIHPMWVALAWWKLYGFPFDPRLWVAFIVHDWGYWGSPEMDGKVGDLHPLVGANIMHLLFDNWHWEYTADYRWFSFCKFHSRFLAAQSGAQPSRLCMADKLSLGLEPWWMYLPRAWASGELKEYMKSAQPGGKHGHMNLKRVSAKEWYRSVQKYLREYVELHRNGEVDQVTKIDRSDQV